MISWRQPPLHYTVGRLMDNPNQALDLLERDIAERLRPVCGHMTAESFHDLVSDIARVKLKYGLQSLASEQMHGQIADFVVMAQSSARDREAQENSG